MAYKINDKLKNLQPYDADIGDYKIRLDANESFVLPSDDIIEEIKTEISKVKLNRYPDPSAKELCAAFAEYYGINSKYVTAGNGSDELISLICSAFTQKGDTFLTVTPDFSMYKFYAHIAECKVIELKKDENSLEIDVDKLISMCNKHNARVLIFSNPCNPTSLGLDRNEICQIVKNVDALVVLDEAYMDFYDQSLLKMVQDYDNLIILRTCSKMMGLAALRIGFAVANERITSALRASKSPYNVNSYSQKIATLILNKHDYLNNCLSEILNSRDFLYNKMREICSNNNWVIFSSKTNFIYLKPDNSSKLYNYLRSEGVLVRVIDEFIRITAGNTRENEESIVSVEKYIKNKV